MELLPDPKKLLPGLLDSDHREELPTGGALLVEMVAGEGSPPDAVAGELQRRQLVWELALLLPGAVLAFSGDWVPWPLKGLVMGTYLYGLWPGLGLTLAWSPFRGRGPRSLGARAQDLVFIVAAFLQSVLVAVPAGALFYGAVDWVLASLGFEALTRAMLAAVPAWLLVGPYVATRCLAASLAERELEDEVLAILPAEERTQASRVLAPGALWMGRLRTLFRAVLLGGLASLPVVYCGEALGLRWNRIPEGLRLIQAVGIALGVNQLIRGFFYAAMAARTQELLATRGGGEAPTPALPGPDAPAREVAPVVLDLTPSLRHPEERAWQRYREPRELAYAVGVAALGAGGAWLVAVRSLTSPALLALGLGYLGLAVAARMGRSLRAAALAAVPAGLALSGTLWLLGQVHLGPIRGPLTMLALLATMTAGLVSIDRACWLWASLTSRLAGGPAGASLPVPRTVAIWRRAMVAGAGTFALGMVGLSLARLVLHLRYSQLHTLAPLMGMAMALQLVLRSYLTGVGEPAPGALPAPTAPVPVGEAAT